MWHQGLSLLLNRSQCAGMNMCWFCPFRELKIKAGWVITILLIVTLNPAPVLLSPSMRMPVHYQITAAHQHKAAYSVASEWAKSLDMPGEPFVAGQIRSEGHVVIMGLPVPSVTFFDNMPLVSQRSLWWQHKQISELLLRDAAAITIAKMSMFVGMSPFLSTLITSKFEAGAMRPRSLAKSPVSVSSHFISFEDGVVRSQHSNVILAQYLQSSRCAEQLQHAIDQSKLRVKPARGCLWYWITPQRKLKSSRDFKSGNGTDA